MNAVDLLKADHDRVEKLFAKFKENEDGNHAALFKQIKNELDTHTHIEETVFYPAALKQGKKDLKDIVREGLEEHAQVKTLLAQLSKMTSSNKQFNPKLKVVMEDVEHHVKEEEDDMFPMAEDQFSDTQLEKLGSAMEAEKIKFQKKHGIKAVPEEKGAVGSIIDKAVELIGDMFTGSAESSKSNGRPRSASKPSSEKANGKGKRNGSPAKIRSVAAKRPSAKSAASKRGKRTGGGKSQKTSPR